MVVSKMAIGACKCFVLEHHVVICVAQVHKEARVSWGASWISKLEV